MTKILLLVLFFFTFSTIYAQRNIAGTVKAEDGRVVDNATVTLSNEETNKSMTVTTDKEGKFKLTDCPNSFLLQVSAFGYKLYKTHKKHFDENTLSIVLHNLSIDEVVVEGNGRPRMSRQGNKLIVDKIENSPYAKGSNLFTFMRFIPVIDMPVNGGQIKLNENVGVSVDVLVNGKPLNIPTLAYLKKLKATDVERIEVVASPLGEYRVSDGRGVINIVLKKMHNKETKYSLYVDDSQEQRNTLSGSFGVVSQIKKLTLSAGLYKSLYQSFSENKSEYRYYQLQRATNETVATRNRIVHGRVYLNADYELDSLNTLGARLMVSWRSTKTRTNVSTYYHALDDEAIDSIYTTATLTKTPTWYSGMSANVNYARKTDNKGSMFFADIDYRYSFPKEYRDYSFEKNNSKESLPSGYTQKYRTYFEGYGLWLRYNANVSGKTSFYNNVNLVLGHSHFDDKCFGMYNLHNIANIRDYTLNASSSYVQRWTNKFSTTLQLTFKALWQRKESADETSVFNRMFFVVPNLKIAYNPSNKHYLSMSLYKSVYVPSYFEMDPMKSFTSPTTYKVGNPYLDVGKNYGVDLNYSFMNNYGISVYMNKIKNVGTDYTVTDGKGNTVITHLNGVNMNELSVSLYGGVYLFDDYLYFSPTFYWAFFRFSNWMNGTRNVNYGRWLNIQPRFNVTLSKKQRIFLYARFDYSSKTQSSNYVRPEDMSISLSLTKNFNNSSLSISASSSMRKYYYIYNETPNFGFNTQTRNYPSIDITYSLTFGNKKVRDVQQRSNAELRGRFGN